MSLDVHRRSVLTLLGASAAAWPMPWQRTARAQQAGGMRRIGVLMGAVNDAEEQTHLAAFKQSLQHLGWTDGGNVRIDDRWAAGESDRIDAYARELVGLKPDVVFVNGLRSLRAAQSQTRNIPIVFVTLSDPVAQGLVQSLARPGGNATGFAGSEFSIIGKCLEGLREAVPQLAQVALLSHVENSASFLDWQHSLETIAAPFGIRVLPKMVRDSSEIEPAIASLAELSNCALIVPSGAYLRTHRGLIIAAANRHRLAAAYPLRLFVDSGGLMSYGVDFDYLFKQAGAYVDRILRGENPSNLPVQAPSKYEFVINLKTAKALGLEIPPILLVRADAVIE